MQASKTAEGVRKLMECCELQQNLLQSVAEYLVSYLNLKLGM